MTKTFFLVFLAVFLIFSPFASAEQSPQVDSTAVEASENFLLLLDAEDYDTAWEESSSVLKIIRPKEEWIRDLKIVRELFGGQINRSVKITKGVPTWIGLPDGDYTIVILSSSFERKKEGMQNIILKRDTGGKWRVAEYTVR